MRLTFILVLGIIFIGCGVRVNTTYIKPGRQGNITFPHEYPVILEFKKNGRCIKTSRHPGSDSGPVRQQVLGNYSISNDSIVVRYIWSRSASSRFNIEDVDWHDLEDSFTTIYRLSRTKDTLTVLETKGHSGAKYILDQK